MPIVEINHDLCTKCNTCVEICPMDVLRVSNEGIPSIAYREDCQSCYLCRHYCPEAAITVTPDRGRPSPLPL